MAINLEQTNLGLSNPQYDHLSQKADTIIHAAAFINHLYGYNEHAPCHVKGMRVLIDLSTKCQQSRIVCISSSGCQNTFDYDGNQLINFLQASSFLDSINGYLQSKLVAEQIALYAQYHHKLLIKIVRIGYITPHSQGSNFQNHKNHMSCLIKMALEKSAYPDWSHSFECLPVDQASANITQFITNFNTKTEPVTNSTHISWSDLFHYVNPNTKHYTHTTWYKNILSFADRITEPYLYQLIPLYKEKLSLTENYSAEPLNDEYRSILNHYIKAVLKK